MNFAEFQLQASGDPRLAAYAASPLPAWLWSADGSRILWANPAGAAVFGAADGAELGNRIFGPADRHRRQVARLSGRLLAGGAIRLERLQGFGAAPGMLATCGCARFDFPDGNHGTLIAAGTIALISPGATPIVHKRAVDDTSSAPPVAAAEAATPVAAEPAPAYEQPSQSGEAPAEFALFDAFAEPLTAPAEQPTANETSEPDLGSVLQLDLPHVEATPLEAPHAEAQEPSLYVEAVADEPADGTAPSSLDEPLPNSPRLPLRFTWQMDQDSPKSSDSAAPPPPWSADIVQAGPAPDEPPAEVPLEDFPDPSGVASPPFAKSTDPAASETSHQTDLETAVEPPQESAQEFGKDLSEDLPAETPMEILNDAPADASKNVLPFRPPGDARPPSLSPVENSAFNELARQLSARLDTENGSEGADITGIDETVVEKSAPVVAFEGSRETPATETPEWLAPPEPPARGEGRRDKALLDLLPVGILIYRLDRLLYANPAFLTQMGYPGLHALEDAGGLDALYVEPGVSTVSSTSDTGTPVTISASQPSDQHAPPAAAAARLYTISWDGDSALALIFSGTRHEGEAVAAALAQLPPAASPIAEKRPQESAPVDNGYAEELGAILDTTAEGIVMFDAEGNIHSCNRSAEALFGHDGNEMARRNLADLFAPESRHAVFDYLAGIKSTGVASLLDHGREVLGRESKGGIIPLSMTMGRTRADGPNFFAVFRDLSQAKKTENELREARRLAERAGTAKADVLARISHEVRTPLNAIIGFAEVMIGERFGALGNERYVEYMKDIRASGERVIAIINDLSDLSRIETGKLDLAFTAQNLNELVESCVAVMQPQANRERIIIRTSLAHTLPPVVADARALRQITLNLIGNSIHLANAGGQVIVSTALSDFGEVMLRVRDTGNGLNDNEVARALEPFRTQALSDQTSDSGVSLSLTKALVEANRAKFQIKTGGRSGTLIEVVFPHAVVRA